MLHVICSRKKEKKKILMNQLSDRKNVLFFRLSMIIYNSWLLWCSHWCVTFITYHYSIDWPLARCWRGRIRRRKNSTFTLWLNNQLVIDVAQVNQVNKYAHQMQSTELLTRNRLQRLHDCDCNPTLNSCHSKRPRVVIFLIFFFFFISLTQTNERNKSETNAHTHVMWM